jgi:2-dehydro-3-deoxy-D-arabinonate dehydratase
MKLYCTAGGLVVEYEERCYPINGRSFDSLVCDVDLYRTLEEIISREEPFGGSDLKDLCAPISNQDVWAAGVTYYRSRDARMEESKGGSDFYDRVYSAERPELFFKSMARNVVGPGGLVKIRRDASWSVPEPELALLVNPSGEIVGYTIGNDMSSRDIEGENPLYLPQAKVYDQSCSLGPCILLQKEPIAESTRIKMDILRSGAVCFTGTTSLAELKRSLQTLVEYLFRDHTFPHGCFLLTGTGIVPPDEFSLRAQDEIRISIDGIGTLTNTVA